jgi:hypothetical protein
MQQRQLWLLGIAFSGCVIWLAGSHLGPGLRAAHGQGIHGQWTAREQVGGQWYGEFVSSSGTLTLPHVSYAGSLSAVQDGTTIPALDTGAADEVYPLTGSGKWVHDVIGVVAGTLALIGLLARGLLFVAGRRGRARRAGGIIAAGGFTRADGFVAGMLPAPKRGLRWAAPRSRAGKLAAFAVAAGVTGYLCARLIVLLADVRPYAGWYWLLALAGGIVIAVVLPWALIRGARRPPRWLGWLLVGYTMALVGGIRYYLSLRFTPPSSAPTMPPPPWLVLEITGLSAVTFTMAATTLLILVAMAEVIAPGSVGGWLRARRTRGAGVNRPPGPVDRPQGQSRGELTRDHHT